MTIDTITLTNITQSQNSLMSAKNCKIDIEGMNLTSAIISNVDEIFYVYDSSILSLTNSYFSSFNSRLISITDSTLQMEATTVTTTSLVGGNTPETGTAVFAQNSNVIATGCTFELLQATGSGTAIYIVQGINERKISVKRLQLSQTNLISNY